LIRKFSTYLGQYRRYLAAVPLLVFVDVMSELAMPLLMARIIDVGIPARDVGYIVRQGLLMILLAFTAITFGVTIMRTTSIAAMGFGANLRDALFAKVQAFSFTNIDRFSTASLITRLTNDVNNVQMTLMMASRLLLRAPMMLIIAFFLAYSINARLSVILAVAIPILAAGIIAVMSVAIRRYSIVQEKVDAINRALQENLIGVRVVKSYVRAGHEIEKFGLANDALTNAAIRAGTIAILNLPLMILVINSASIAIIWFGGRMVAAGALGTGELISFISYVFQILFSVMMISMVILMSARAQASGKRLLEVLDTEIDIVEKPAPTLPAVHAGKVEFRNVSFKYNRLGSGEDVLCDISVTIQPGEVVGVVGGTGVGKSTLVHLIPRLYDVTAGAVLVDDVDVRDYPLEDLRAQVGMVLQKNTLFTGTIRDNLLWGNPNATQAEIEAACRDAAAHDFIIRFPDGYDTILDQGGVNLSGGQRQRLTIARAMLKKPKILILDDSTSAVDSATEARIRESFYHNLAHTTVLIIAQRISSVRDADKIIVLDDGKVAGIGTHQDLLASNPIYQEINASQQEGALSHG